MGKIDKQMALSFSQSVMHTYFSKRDFETLLSLMDERVTWIGSGDGEICENLLEARESFKKETEEYSGAFIIESDEYKFVSITDTVAVVYGEIKVSTSDMIVSGEDLRFSLTLQQTNDKIHLIHGHFSHADIEQEKGKHFVTQKVKKDNQDLRGTLDKKERQLSNLTKNIPGGAHQCTNDEDMTLISMSDSFLSMFGYTEKEIQEIFCGKYINMIYPHDREEVLKDINRQIEKSNEIELEYRVLCKDGTPIWVIDKGRLIDNGLDGKCFYCLLIEITDRKREQEELRLTLERHQVIMNQTKDIIFEWDVLKDGLTFSVNWFKKFGYEAICERVSKSIPLSKNIHEEDIGCFQKIMQEIIRGADYAETELRIRDIKGKYYWCRVRVTTQYNADLVPVKAVGVIIDIDQEKKQTEKLLEQAQRDALTGLYNKAAIKILVEEDMKNKNQSRYCALLIIDVDHFKAVNDRYGHLYGDTVLLHVATALKNNTRSGDLVARIGGDEFLVYLTNVVNQDAVKKKAEALVAALHQIRPALGALPITCSIGVAVSSEKNMDYYTLYEHADQALYKRKNTGRAGVTFFDEQTAQDFKNMGFSISAVGLDIVSENSAVVDEGLSQYVFRTLYESCDTKTAIDKLLDIIGRSFDVSRAYIVENSEDGRYCSNTFEWCNEDALPQINILQNIEYVDGLEGYIENFDVRGMFYCHNVEDLHPDVYAILKPQGIRSMLQCAMLDEGEYKGYIGFDECRENREWTPRQVAAFKLCADVLSTFLIKFRQKQKVRLLQKNIKSQN